MTANKLTVNFAAAHLAGEAVAGDGETVEGAENGDGDLFRLEKSLSESLDFLASDSLDGCKDFVERREAVEVEFLAREVGHAGTGRLEGEHQRTFQVIFGAQQFFFGDRRLLHGAEFGDGHIEDLADGFLGGTRINTEHPRIGIGSEFAEDGIGEAVFFANILKETRRHATAEKIVEYGDTEAALVSDGQRRNADAEVYLLEIFLGLEMNGRSGSGDGVFAAGLGGRQVSEFLLHELQDLIVSDVSGSGDQNVIGSEPILKAAAKSFAIELANGLRSAEDRTAEGMIGPETTSKDVVEKILGIVEIHLDLFENDLALLFDVVGIEFRTENKIGKDIEGDGEVLVEYFSVETNLFFRGEGIEHAADGIHFAGNVFGGAAFGAFKHHVLKEVGETVFGGDFAAGAVADPDADGDRTDVLHGLGDNDEAVG